MKYAKDLTVRAAAVLLALPLLLTACSQGAPPATTLQDRGATHTDGALPAATGGMPEVVIMAQRERPPRLVLAERKSGTVAN